MVDIVVVMVDTCGDLWDNLLKGDKAVKACTADGYRKMVGMMEKVSGVPLHKALANDAHAVIKALRKHYSSLGTLSSICTAIMSLYSHTPEFAAKHKAAHERWRKFATVVALTYRKERDDNHVTEEIRAKIPTCAEIRKAMAGMDPLASLRDSQHYIMLAMSVDNPPKRRDFGALEVLRSDVKDTKGNYVVVGAKVRVDGSLPLVKLVMQDYKTDKKYGRHVEYLSEKLSDTIRQSIQAFPRKFLFTGRFGALSDGAYGEFVRTVFRERVGKAVGVNALRHMYITDRIENGNMSTAERKELARSMNHSVSLQLEYNVPVLPKKGTRSEIKTVKGE